MNDSPNQPNELPRRQVLKNPAAEALSFSAFAHLSMNSAAAAESTNSLFDTQELLDARTWALKMLQDWHPAGATCQKLIEIHVAEWWPGQEERSPVRMTVPLNVKAQGFQLAGANPCDPLHVCLQN